MKSEITYCSLQLTSRRFIWHNRKQCGAIFDFCWSFSRNTFAVLWSAFGNSHLWLHCIQTYCL